MGKLAVIFPGIGYTPDKPLLYYAAKEASEHGYDKIIKLKFTSENKENIRNNPDAMKRVFEKLYEEAQNQLSEVVFGEYEEILFVSKSIGTIIASAYAKNHRLDVRHLLYTPLEFTFDFEPKNALAFIGTNDPWSNAEKVIEMSEEAGVPIEVYEGLNHSLETDDTMKNIEILKDVMKKTKDFLEGER